MTSLFSYLITMFGGLFWILRIVVAITYSMDIDFPIEPLDFNIEIILLFVTLFCIILIIKRNLIGALIYFITYGLYFGTDLYNNFVNISNNQIGVTDYLSIFISLVGVIISFLTFLDIGLNKNRTGTPRDKKTDWFYKNKDYDRKLDERADKNNYRTM